MGSSLCCAMTSEHGACLGVQLIFPVTLSQRKQFSIFQQLLFANSFSANDGICDPFPFSGLNMLGSYVLCHILCGFTCALAMMCLENCFFFSRSHPLLLDHTIFLHLLPHRCLNLEVKGMVNTPNLGLSIPMSFNLFLFYVFECFICMYIDVHVCLDLWILHRVSDFPLL